MSNKEKKVILEPINQKYLYGYKDYFQTFLELYKNDKLPSITLFTGPKGLGKSTFAFHFTNYLLSQNEKDKYSTDDFKISTENSSFKLVQNQIHTNFFLLSNTLADENIKIDQTRYLLKYLHKTTYSKNIKIVLLDNAEFLNINSSNSLLKIIEEPPKNTYFFIICNNTTKLIHTIKSRCLDFKFHFTTKQKTEIFTEIIKEYDFNYKSLDLEQFLYIETQGNLLKYLEIFNSSNLNFCTEHLPSISYLMDLYKTKKIPDLLKYITFFIENFYRELTLKNNTNINNYIKNKNKILEIINDMNKYNLDKKNSLFSISQILHNER